MLIELKDYYYKNWQKKTKFALAKSKNYVKLKI